MVATLLPSKLLISLVSAAVGDSPPLAISLKISISRLKQGFSKLASHSGVLQRYLRNISSGFAILISISKGHYAGTTRDHSGQYPVQYLENIGLEMEQFYWSILVIGPLTA